MTSSALQARQSAIFNENVTLHLHLSILLIVVCLLEQVSSTAGKDRRGCEEGAPEIRPQRSGRGCSTVAGH